MNLQEQLIEKHRLEAEQKLKQPPPTAKVEEKQPDKIVPEKTDKDKTQELSAANTLKEAQIKEIELDTKLRKAQREADEENGKREKPAALLKKELDLMNREAIVQQKEKETSDQFFALANAKRNADTYVLNKDTEIKDRDNQITKLNKSIAALNYEIKLLDGKIEFRENRIKTLDQTIKEKLAAVNDTDSTILLILNGKQFDLYRYSQAGINIGEIIKQQRAKYNVKRLNYLWFELKCGQSMPEIFYGESK